MDKWDTLESKVTEKKGSSKKTVILCVVVGILVACGLFVGGMQAMGPIVDDYLSTNDRAVGIITLYDFYDLKKGEDATSVYFIGSSLIQDSVAPSEINRLLEEYGYNISVYDLGVSGDRTELRTLQINNIIESKPSLVVYGISYITLSYETWISEYTVLVDNRINLSEDAYSMYSSDELKEILGGVDPLSKDKIFLESSIKQWLTSTPESTKNEANKLLNSTWTRITGEGQVFSDSYVRTPAQERRIQNIEDPFYPWRAEIGNTTNREIEALYYNVNKLQEAGIPVVIINMPLNPLLSGKITDETRENYFDILDKSGAKWYDLEYLYGEEYFADSHHLFPICGMKYFSPVMADLIIEEVKSGAVHYA